MARFMRFAIFHCTTMFFGSFLFCSYVNGLDLPSLENRINDFAYIISDELEAQLEIRLINFEITDPTPLVVVTVASLNGEDIENYAWALIQKWALVQKNTGNGALVLISRGEEQVHIEVGDGLIEILTDTLCDKIIDYLMSPAIKKGNFDEGLKLGLETILGIVNGEVSAADIEKPGFNLDINKWGGFVVAVSFLCFIIINRITAKYHFLAMFSGGLICSLCGLIFGVKLVVASVLFFTGGFLGFVLARLKPTHGNSDKLQKKRRGRINSSDKSSDNFRGADGGYGGAGASGKW